MKMSPEDVLKECGIREIPVPLEQITEYYGIEVHNLRGSSDIFGAIIRKGGKATIALNPAQHPNRQRFTIAHELGHYFCHPNEGEHIDGDFRVSWRDEESSKGIDWNEVEANRFAAALLMPEQFLRKDLHGKASIDDALVKRLARRYQVSEIAMRYRLQNLGLFSPMAHGIPS